MELHRRLLRVIDDSAAALELPSFFFFFLFLQIIYSVRMLERPNSVKKSSPQRELCFKLELSAAMAFILEETG